jgi:hypothetical protein
MKCRTRLPGWLVPAALTALTAAAWAGDPTPNPVPAGDPIVLRFHNGTVVQPAALLDAVEMETKLGKLSIPAKEVRRIDFGFRLAEEDARKLERALRELGSDKHKAREAAQKTLRDMGRLAYPALRDASKGTDLETTRRVEAILKDIKARVPADRLQVRRHDVVRTSDSVVSGRITSAALRVRCDLFGEVKLPVVQMRDLHSLLPGGELVVAVDAAKYGNRVTWMDTGFEVSHGTRLEITATGEINLDPNNAVGNPNLTRNVGPEGRQGFNVNDIAFAGTLVGRIGTDGRPFVVGRRYNSHNPDREGKLFLRVLTLESTNNIRAEGSYQVRISAELN